MEIFLEETDNIISEKIKESRFSIDFTGIITTNPNFSLDTKLVYHLVDKVLFDDNKRKVGIQVKIGTPEDMQSLLDLEVTDDEQMLIIETGSWHIIPLENLIAKYDGSNTKLYAKAGNLEEFKLLQNILEIGLTGCILDPSDEINFNQIQDYLNSTEKNIVLTESIVESVEKVGVGDRVCVDTCSILKEGEGLLVGSTAKLFVLIEAEVHESGFVNARPFRINAGVVALYTLNGEKTNYLSELKAGVDVQIVDRDGKIKSETIARIKVERRPCILIKVILDDKSYPVILQDAETVRIMTKDGSIPITELSAGMKILTHIAGGGRHFGMKVDEFLDEK